ncbi:decapping and exoribonuclease protein [Periophthalmus magnuspinnatus]|uniref:decapping and exoribonuclease protein n=1 Tax=Periophthalmus magnuspinnatus TaxID=409849 RepID=UPI00145A86D5|nr:decapping and exoribonuclease protein [Periophthalmus magnuspinnatus]
MDRYPHPHASRDSGPSCQHHRRKREHSGFPERSHHQNKHFQPSHHEHLSESGQSYKSYATSLQTLSTKKELYEKVFPLYKQPIEVGCFSLDSERRFFNDKRQLRFYTDPGLNPSFDLRDGFKDRYVKRDENVKEKLDHILRWIISNKAKVTSKDISNHALDADVVTWRGHLTKLLTTPYESREGWMFAVSKFRGTVYISEVETEAARRDRENRTERHSEMMYWGYKFEQYMCADDIDCSPDPSGVVNTNEAFCTVVQTRLADHRLLFSGEVDCRVRDLEAPGPPACYVELKTSVEICTPKQRSNFHRFKLLKWWAQSFLPGVPQVVAGFRDHDGVVIKVETFQISKISQLIKGEYNCWKPTVCMNFCNDFLTFVKQVVSEDNPSVVYLFSWEPHRDVAYTIHRDSQYCFLPEWYVEEIKRTQT